MSAALAEIKSVFGKALELSPPERAAYLNEACRGNPDVRTEVEALLRAQPAAGAFFAAVRHSPDDTVEYESLGERPGALVGPYKLLQQIGEGGFGVVYLAEQSEPVRRRVALKILKPGMDSRQIVARFEAERQALALMDHPNIARVFDGGATPSGRPFFVMEVVKGVPITDFCDQNRLTTRQRLELFISVCHAVQHAHHKGIVHRDLKPSNVMVSRSETMPVVKVIDFGVAKALGQELTDKTLFTGMAQMIGTPLYMSPEQAGMSFLDTDTRSDIYSLGVLLYELLTGSTPFDKERFKQVAYDELRRIIREEDPAKPSTRLSESKVSLPSISAQRQTEPARLTKLVRGELDWIVMKALDKDRNRRYETANDFAMDVQRYLTGEPVQAGPPSRAYWLRKFVWRNRGVFTAATLIAIALVVGTAMSAWQAIRATKAETLAKERLEGEQAQHTLAQKNAADANARRLEAETARQEAIANLEQARAAVDQLLTRVSEEKLLNAPHMEPLRKALLEDALRFYQRFLQQAGSDLSVRRGTGEAYRRQGQIYRQLGQPDQAERAYREAIALLEKLAADAPTDPANRLALALSYHGLGGVVSHLGRYAESESTLRRAVVLMRELVAQFPQHDGYPRILATMDAELDWVSERLIRVAGKPKTEAFYRENLQFLEKLLAAAPNDPQRRHAVTYAQMELGRSLQHRRPQEAERLFRNVIAGNRKLTSEFPHTPEYRKNLAEAYHHLFLLLRANRRFEEAERVYRQSLPNINKVVADAPNVPYLRRLLVEHYWDYALMLEAAGQPHDAEKAFQHAIIEVEAMCAEFPTYAWTPARLACIYNHVGNQHRRGGRLPQAEAAYRKALDVSEKAVRAFPHAELRDRFVDSCLYLGLLFRMSDRQQEATSVFRKLLEAEPRSAYICNHAAWRLATDIDLQLYPWEIAAEFARQAIELEPTNANAWNTLGVVQFRAGNWKETINAVQKAKDLRQGGDSFDGFLLAMVHWKLGNKDDARNWYHQAVEWMEKNQPDNEELLRFQAEAEQLLGINQKQD